MTFKTVPNLQEILERGDRNLKLLLKDGGDRREFRPGSERAGEGTISQVDHKEAEQRSAQKRGNKRDTSPAAEATQNWNDPDASILDDRRGELPVFPLDVLPASWREWATNAAQGAGVTVDHVLVPLLAVVSSLIGTSRRVTASKSWSQPFTVWTSVVGFSGSGKTPGLDVTRRALAKIDRDRKDRIAELQRKHNSDAERARAAYKKWKAEVEEALENSSTPPPMPNDAALPDEFVAPRLYVSNSTVEKVVLLLQA